MKADYYGDINIGNVRSRNEDRCVLKEVWEGSHLLAVAIDGVGGSVCGGDVAAEMAARCIEEHICGCMPTPNSLDVLHAAVVYANNEIYMQRRGASTCVLTAALINLESGIMSVCHVGDTRLYELSGGTLKKHTSDHSWIAHKEESGEYTEEQAMKHPQRNVITRSVGKDILHWGTEYIQTHTIQLEPCTLLLCSDGLYDMVHSQITTQILSEQTPVEERVDKLIDAALDAGGKDNITVIVIDLIK